MNYILENQNEAQRLEKQNTLPQYCIKKEIEYLGVELNKKKILDAGCGVGSLSKVLSSMYEAEIHGCDASAGRINEAKKNIDGVHFFEADITSLDCSNNTYDIIFARFVLEHTTEPEKILNELYRVLKPGGIIVIIELDGLIFNLHHENKELEDYLERIKKYLPIDLFIGRKLPRMLVDSGFSLDECHVQPMVFKDHELDSEIENMKMRFSQSKEAISKIIGEENFDHFVSLYLFKMRKSQITFCNKFILTAKKPE